MPKIKAKDQGKKFYQMRKDGLTNAQIAERHGLEPHTVGARVSEYRKKNKLPHISRKRNGFYQSTIDEEKIRKENMKKAYVREDGIIQLPTKTCEGFGFNSLIYDLASQ